VLERAQAAVWPIDKAKEIPGAFLKAFMLRGTGPEEGRMKAGPLLRSSVRFQRVNLNAEPFTFAGRFDLVFCRNVLIYFDAASKARVVGRLLERLEPQGYLFLGHAETVTGLNARTRSVGPTVYAHAEAPVA
jgi:chemotaxis protein methyltransferase CheR